MCDSLEMYRMQITVTLEVCVNCTCRKPAHDCITALSLLRCYFQNCAVRHHYKINE